MVLCSRFSLITINSLLIIEIFLINYYMVSAYKKDNDQTFMLVRTPDNEKVQDKEYALVKKQNGLQSLLKLEHEDDNQSISKSNKGSFLDYYPN